MKYSKPKIAYWCWTCVSAGTVLYAAVAAILHGSLPVCFAVTGDDITGVVKRLLSLLPVTDLWMTSGTLGRSEGGCFVRSVRIPPWLSQPSLDRNYIIAACDLILLKEHFEVSFPFFPFWFPLPLFLMLKLLTLNHPLPPIPPTFSLSLPVFGIQSLCSCQIVYDTFIALMCVCVEVHAERHSFSKHRDEVIQRNIYI